MAADFDEQPHSSNFEHCWVFVILFENTIVILGLMGFAMMIHLVEHQRYFKWISFSGSWKELIFFSLSVCFDIENAEA